MRQAFVFFLTAVLCAALPAQAQEQTQNADGAVLRVLDRVSGEVSDVSLPASQSFSIGPLSVGLDECRCPVDNLMGDAYARLTVIDMRSDALVFSGWMVASSPALNPLDHARYDVWVLRCNMETGSTQ